MSINHELAKINDGNKDILLAFDGKNFYAFAMVYIESYYPRIEIGYLCTQEREQRFNQQLNNITFIQFKDQASAFLKIRYYLS